MKPVGVKLSTYIDFNNENNIGGPKFKIGENVRISKYKNDFAKDYVWNWSRKKVKLRKLKTLCCGHMVLVILKAKKLLERFLKKKYKK